MVRYWCDITLQVATGDELDLGPLDITTDDYLLDEVDGKYTLWSASLS